MNPCEKHSVNILRYLDNELHGAELEQFSAHLKVCTHCTALVEQEQELSRLLRRTRPLYSAPEGLRARVADITASQNHEGARQGLLPRLAQALETGAQWVPSWKVLAPTALMILLALIIVPYAVQEARAANYVDTALATHRAYLSGNLSPEIRSNSPEEVTAWFAGKLQFSFRLPDSRLYPGKPAYQLTGARSVTYKGNTAALVTYEAQKDKISLLIAPSRSAVIAGGDEIRSGSLTFHYQYKAGFKVITWSNHGLSYALVSTVSGSARESCLVCHQSMKDRGAFEAQE